jgi:hypothetical protein
MKQEFNINNTKITIEITPQKLYGKIFTDWVEEKYRGVLPKLTITKKCDKILSWGYGIEKIKRIEEWEVSWRFENNFNFGNTKTLTMECRYNSDGSIDNINFRDGLIYRGPGRWNSKSEKGLKISMRTIVNKFLNNPNYRGNPSWCEESELFTPQF